VVILCFKKSQHTAAVAEGDADELRRELEKSKRRHAKEVASLQQRLLSSSSGSLVICSRCAKMADKKTGDDGDCIQAGTAIVVRSGKTTSAASESLSALSDFGDGTCVYESWDARAAFYRKGDPDSEFEEDDHETATPSIRFSRAQYQDLTNLEIDFEDDDGFLCEQCGEPATNGMRVCDSCI
jgi:hypothetical protein